MVLKPGSELHNKALSKAAEFNDWRIARDNIVQVLRLMERTNGRVGHALAAKFCHIVQSDNPNESWWMDYSHLDEGLKELLIVCQEAMDRTEEGLGKLLKEHGIGAGVASVMNGLVKLLPKPNRPEPSVKKKKKKKNPIGFLPAAKVNKKVKRLALISRPHGENA